MPRKETGGATFGVVIPSQLLRVQNSIGRIGVVVPQTLAELSG